MSPSAGELTRRLRAAGCVWAEEEAALLLGEGLDDDELERRVLRRIAGEPLETVLGWTTFRGIRIRVAPGVFVPRPRTELLVELALERTPIEGIVADICCGSGALGAALLAERPRIALVAADLDPVAVAVARTNLPGIPVEAGDLFSALPERLRGGLDVVLANVPYVPTPEFAFLPAEAREHEPRHTLDGGADGLDLLRRVAADAAVWLRPGGSLLCEIAEGQIEGARDALRSAGLEAEVRTDEETETTVVIGVRPAVPAVAGPD